MVLILLLLLYAFALAMVGLVVAFLFKTAKDFLRGEPPFVPVPRAAAHALPQVMHLPPGSVLYDLGAGDGRTLFAMARAYPASNCIGIERSLIPYLFSKVRLYLRPLPNVTLVRGDFYSAPWSDATHIFLYLFPASIDALLPLFAEKLPRGATVVSCDFTSSARAPDAIIPVGAHMLYRYILPAGGKKS